MQWSNWSENLQQVFLTMCTLGHAQHIIFENDTEVCYAGLVVRWEFMHAHNLPFNKNVLHVWIATWKLVYRIPPPPRDLAKATCQSNLPKQSEKQSRMCTNFLWSFKLEIRTSPTHTCTSEKRSGKRQHLTVDFPTNQATMLSYFQQIWSALRTTAWLQWYHDVPTLWIPLSVIST